MREPNQTIRQAEQEDLPALAELCRQWAAEELTRGYRSDTVEELEKRLGEWFLVAKVGDQIVGFVVGGIKPTAGNEFVEGVLSDKPAYLEVQDLYVAKPHRNTGIGTALMTELLDRAQKAGVSNSMVYSANKDYCRTAAYYEKLGYQMWHIIMTRKV